MDSLAGRAFGANLWYLKSQVELSFWIKDIIAKKSDYFYPKTIRD